MQHGVYPLEHPLTIQAMNKILIELQCFAPVDCYINLIKHDILIWEQYEHFQKGSLTNRYYLAGPNGRILLSVPLQHAKRSRIPFRDLEICNLEKWQSLHWKTLCSCYRRSPWFEYFEPELQEMYAKPFRFLLDWNLEAFDRVSTWLGRSWTQEWTNAYEKSVPNPSILDLRGRFMSQSRASVRPSGMGSYRQVFEDRTGFLDGLSILDLLFCAGKRTTQLLESGLVESDPTEGGDGPGGF